MGAIAKAYGFEFPADLVRFWSVAKKHEDALFDAGVRLVGPFTILGGGRPDDDLDRWPADPPELFTVAEGDTDGLHWGYVLHEPGKPGYVASFYGRDGYPITYAGPTLGHAMHAYISDVAGEKQDELAEIRAVGEDDDELAGEVARLERLERALRPLRAKRARPKKEPTPSLDGLGVRVPRGPAVDPKKLRKDPERLITQGFQHIADGRPALALPIARDALAILPTEKQDNAVLLAVAAYEALGRPLLARTFAPRLAAIHRRRKRPPKVDNRFSDTMERALLNPEGVRVLALEQWGAQPRTPDLDAIAKLVNLESLTLRGYPIGDLPKGFRALKKLREVELFLCAMRSLPSALATLPIEELEITQSIGARNPRQAVRVPKGFSLPKLRKLSLVACGLREIPAFVLRAKRLLTLSLDGNRLEELPDGVGALTDLRYLSVADNALTTLPPSLAKAKKLGSLWLKGNRLAAAPEVLGALRLRALDLGKNPLVARKEERARAKALAKRAKIYFA